MTHSFVCTPDLFGVFDRRKRPASTALQAYPAPVAKAKSADTESMLFWLTRAARARRVGAGRKQVHIAASADKDQSTVYRFEKAQSWPRDTDVFVEAYADDLDVEAIDLWSEALEMWRRYAALSPDERQQALEDLAQAADPGGRAAAPRNAPSQTGARRGATG